ncbi:MAG: BofC C-terminal domain-containing protein [Clostridia bacterium]|nr:BofC C-terminal domain-containing protein [Clostridia bacterium]
MKKTWIIILIIVIIVIGVIFGIFIYNKNKKNTLNENIIENKINEVSEKITDECTEEWEELEEEAKQDILETNAADEKISPNCVLILRSYYKGCQHTINKYIDMPQDLINKTKEDLIQKYSDYEIKKYSSTEIIIYKEYDEECGEHYILRNDEGKITIYRITKNNEEEIYEKTEISIDYLTETDKIKIENGIRVNGKEELNQLIEDFE